MFRPWAVIASATAAGPTVSGPSSGYPITAPCVPAATVDGSSVSGRPSGADVCRTARSNVGSKNTGVAGYSRPSTTTRVVVRSPATTWALVTTVPGATTKPEPSWRYPHAWPRTLTVEPSSGLATFWAHVSRGVATWTGVGSSWEKTGGKPDDPRNDWTLEKTSGSGGMTLSTARTRAER